MKRKVRPSITDNSQASFTRAVELRGALSTIDMKPIASFGPTVSMTLSPMTISIMPDCTMYMQLPGSPLLKTTVPAANARVAPAPRANAHISMSVLLACGLMADRQLPDLYNGRCASPEGPLSRQAPRTVRG